MKRSLTRGDIVGICLELSKLFEENFGGEHKFRPLKRIEGGVEYFSWPGKREQQCKEIKCILYWGAWPWVQSDWEQAWLTDEQKDCVAVSHQEHVWTTEQFPYGSEKSKERFVKILNNTERRNMLWLKHLDTRWKKKEVALIRKYLKDTVQCI